MARRKPATINDDFEAVFEESAPVPPALARMERDPAQGEPRTADVHPAEVERWKARGRREARVGAVREPPLQERPA